MACIGDEVFEETMPCICLTDEEAETLVEHINREKLKKLGNPKQLLSIKGNVCNQSLNR